MASSPTRHAARGLHVLAGRRLVRRRCAAGAAGDDRSSRTPIPLAPARGLGLRELAWTDPPGPRPGRLLCACPIARASKNRCWSCGPRGRAAGDRGRPRSAASCRSRRANSTRRSATPLALNEQVRRDGLALGVVKLDEGLLTILDPTQLPRLLDRAPPSPSAPSRPPLSEPEFRPC